MNRFFLWGIAAAVCFQSAQVATAQRARPSHSVGISMNHANANEATSMHGKVVNREGQAIAGAKVMRLSGGMSREYFSQSIHTSPDNVLTQTTDAQGSFTLPLEQNNNYTIAVQSPGYVDYVQAYQRWSPPAEFSPAAADGTVSATITLQKRGTLKGIVADEKMQPMPGVSITAFPATIIRQDSINNTLDQTESDGDGHFTLNQVPDAPLLLRFTAPGYATAYQPVSSGDNVAINLTRGETVTGVVKDINGNPMGGLRVSLSAVNPTYTMENRDKPKPFPKSWGALATSGESGAFSYRNVPPGNYHVGLSFDSHQQRKYSVWNPGSNYLQITVPETGAPTPIQLTVFPGYTIKGRVVESGTTNTIAGARITIPWFTNPEPATTSDESGAFQFEKLFDRSNVQLAAEAKGFRLVSAGSSNPTTPTITVEFPKDSPVVEVTLPMERMQAILGRVLDAETSQPISGARIALVKERYNPNSPEVKEKLLFSDSDGRFSVQGYLEESTRLRAEVDGYAPAISEPLIAHAEGETILPMYRGHALQGIVLDPIGKPVAGAKVSGSLRMGGAQSASGARQMYHESVSATTTTSANGSFTIEKLPPGTELTVWAFSESFAPSEVTKRFIPKDEDITSVVLKLREAKNLSGRVLDKDGNPLAMATISANSQDTNGSGYFRTQQDGRYAITNLPDAPVDIWIQHPEHGMEYFYGEAVGRENVDFQFGKGDKDGANRSANQSARTRNERKTGASLHGRVVDYKTNLPVKDFKVNFSYGAKVVLDPDAPGEFTVEGLLVSSPYQTLRIIAPGYAPYDSGSIYIHPGQTKIEKTFKLGPGGSIIGRAVDKDSKAPVAGIIVSLGEDLYSPMPLPSSLKPKPVVTAADGKFELAGVGQGRKVVSFEPPPESGYVKMTQEVEIIYNESTDVENVEFGAGGGITGKLVRMPGNVPIPNARIEARNQQPTTTDADGAFTFTGLVNGLYFVEAPDYGANSWIGIDNLETKELTLEVGSGKLLGTVTRAGQPVSCEVKLQKTGPGQSVARFITADSAGRFVVEGLAPGRWGVQFTGKGSQAFTAGDFVIMPNTGEDAEKTFTLPSGALRITVVDGGSQPVKGATVTVRQQSSAESALQANPSTGVTDANGQISFSGLDAGTYAATATTVDNRRASRESLSISNGQSAEETLALEMAAGGTLVSVALNISNGKPLPTAWCYLFDENGKMFEHNSQRDELGMMTINNIPPGTYSAQVSAFSFSANQQTVVIRSGETKSIEDVLYPAGALRWVIRDASGAPVVGADCTLTPTDANSIETPRSGTTNAEGMYIVRGLTAGSYTATAKTKDGKSVTTGINISAANATDAISMVN